MKRFTLLLCLFFVAVQICLPVNAEEMDYITQAQQTEDLSACSARLAQEASSLREEQQAAREKLSALKIQLEASVEEQGIWEQKQDPLYQKGKLLARLAQRSELSFTEWLSFSCSVSGFLENRPADDSKALQDEIRKISIRNAQIEEQLEEISQAQQILQERWTQPDLQGGIPETDHAIQNTDGLPSIGSVTAQESAASACLVGLDFSEFVSSSGFLWPVSGGSISAGTWAYPGGSMHLGLDIAASMFSPVFAPINGVILYANNPVSSDCGYLGNFCGWPYGGGNTICLLGCTDDQIYAVTFAHLSSSLNVHAGQVVSQGDVIALSGNSGNSTGPHTHVEVFRIHVSFEEAAAYFAQGADFAFGCGFSAPATSSAYATRIRPESVFCSV